MGVTIVETGGWGGIGHYAHCLCSAIQGSGEEVRLLTHARNYALDSFAKTYEVVKIFQGDGFLLDWQRLYATWKDRPTGIIHFQSLLSTRRDWLVFSGANRLSSRTKLILTTHNVLPHEILPGEPFAYRRLFASASGLIVHSNFSRDALKSFMGPRFKTPVAVIPHGHYGELVEANGLARTAALQLLDLPDKQYLVFFGAIRPYKGVDLLLQAAAAVSEWPRDLEILIAGQTMAGVSQEDLCRLRDKLGIGDRVTLRLEYFPESHLPAIFSVADLIALPYRKIDQSGILMAALAAGRPVLCTPVGAFPETVHPRIGFLAEEASVASLQSTGRKWAPRHARRRGVFILGTPLQRRP